MQSLRLYILLLTALVSIGVVLGQAPSKPSLEYTRSRLELAITHALEDDYIDQEELEQAHAMVDDWLAHPRDINLITAEELAEYRLLSPYQIYQFIRYRAEQSGYISSLYDLKTITGWDETTALTLAPLLYIGKEPTKSWLEGLERGRIAASTLYKRVASRPEASYLGTSTALSLRGQYVARDRLSVFLGAERDAFEPWRYGSRIGFDSYTGYASIHRLGAIRSLIVGDYRASWGEGLVLSQGFRMRPPYATGQKTSSIRPLQSLSESEHSRGIAIDLEHHRWRLLLLYSSQWLDGRIDEAGQIIGLSEVGLHRSELELERRHTIPMKHWGGRLAWASDRLSLGGGLLSQSFAPYHLRHAPGAAHNLVLDSIGAQTTISTDYSWVSRSGRIRLSGEVAHSSIGGWATAHQLHILGGLWGDWTLALRHVSPSYWTYYGRTYTHTLRPNDEQGIACFVETRELLPRWLLSLGLDVYKKISHPEQGTGMAMRFTAEHQDHTGGHWRIICAYRRPPTEAASLRMSLQKHWVGTSYSLTPQLALSRYASSWGWIAAVKGELTISSKLQLWGVAAYCDTSWRGRLYLSEPRLRYDYGFTMLHGKGVRLSSGTLWSLTPHITLGLRAAYTPTIALSTTHRSEISAGLYIK